MAKPQTAARPKTTQVGQVPDASTKAKVSYSGPPCRIQLIGTSLVRNVSEKIVGLGLGGVTAEETCVPGNSISGVIRGMKKENNAKPNPEVTHAVLQAGGLDLQALYTHKTGIAFSRKANFEPPTHKDQILKWYSRLVSDTRVKYPNARIFVGEMPKRGLKFGDLQHWVLGFNEDLERLAKEHNCTFIKASPTNMTMYKPDGLHFNETGVKHYASCVAQRVTGVDFRSKTPATQAPASA